MDLSVGPYASGFRGPGVLIKRSTIVDLSVRRVVQRSRYLTKHPPKIKKYTKIDCRAFAFSRRYAAANRTARDILNLGHFWVDKIQGGQCPLCPLIKNIPAIGPTFSSEWCRLSTLSTPSTKWCIGAPNLAPLKLRHN